MDVRSDIFKNTLDLCPRNELNRCLCEDSKTTERAPFDLLTILSCRPKKVSKDLTLNMPLPKIHALLAHITTCSYTALTVFFGTARLDVMQHYMAGL